MWRRLSLDELANWFSGPRYEEMRIVAHVTDRPESDRGLEVSAHREGFLIVAFSQADLNLDPQIQSLDEFEERFQSWVGRRGTTKQPGHCGGRD
jgi:hypothetical protein